MKDFSLKKEIEIDKNRAVIIISLVSTIYVLIVLYINRNEPKVFTPLIIFISINIVLIILNLFGLKKISQVLLLLNYMNMVITLTSLFSSGYVYTIMSVNILLTILFNDKKITHFIGLLSIFGLFIFIFIGKLSINATIIEPYGIPLVNNVQVALFVIILIYLLTLYIQIIYNKIFNAQQDQYLKLIELNKKLVEQTKIETIKAISSGISHDFNNTIQIINSYIDILKTENLPNNINKIITEMELAIQNAQLLSNQLLNMVKGTQNNKKQIINSLVNLIKTYSKLTLINSNIDLVYEINYDAAIHSVPSDIVMVIQNIILNSRQALESVDKNPKK